MDSSHTEVLHDSGPISVCKQIKVIANKKINMMQ